LCFRGERSLVTAVLLGKLPAAFPGQLSDGAIDEGSGWEYRFSGYNTSQRDALCARVYLLYRLTRLVWLGIMTLPVGAVWLARLARVGIDDQSRGIRRDGRDAWAISS